MKKKSNVKHPEVLPTIRENTIEDEESEMEELFRSIHETIEEKKADAEREKLDEIKEKHCIFYTNEDLHREAIISMSLPSSKIYPKGTNEYCGKFATLGDLTSFQMMTGELNGEKIICQKVDHRIQEIIRLLSESEALVAVAGEIKRNRFLIKAIHIVKDTKADRVPKNDLQLQAFLTRQLSNDFSNVVASTTKRRVVFTKKEELRALYRCCRDSYPESIQIWADNYFENLDVPLFGSDDKRHIMKSLEYVLNVDWSIREPTIKGIDTIRVMMDERFYGLDSVKERILEIAAQIKTTKTLPKWGILLCGPAGVGKSSIADAIADIFSMPKAYIEFSTLRDSEALSGSSRIYSNGKPGMIMEQLYALGTANAVMILSEIDKANAGTGHGNPIDVCFSLLDGMGFTDNYLEQKIPTDGLFFVATCNDPSVISKAILDRFYRIDVPAYSAADKKVIFEQYTMPQALDRLGLEPKEITLSNQAKALLFSGYALEPGVRDIEQYFEKLTSHYLLLKEQRGIDHISYTADDLHELFGPSKQDLRIERCESKTKEDCHRLEEKTRPAAFYVNEEVHRKAFMSLRLPRDKEYSEGMNEFYGKFLAAGEYISFKVMAGKLTGAQITCRVLNHRVYEIIRQLSESDTPLAVAGEIKEDRLLVKAIHVTRNPNGNKIPKNDWQLQTMLARQLAPWYSPATTSTTKGRSYFTRKDELQVLYRCCRDSYPESVQAWAENYFNNLDAESLGADDKRHILKSLDYVLNVDWTIREPTIKEIESIKRTLDQRFYGLESVKERILEIAAQIRATKTLPKWGILLCGPAGVGKSSIADAIAELLSMAKMHIEFSTLRDSETLSGSARIYENGKPGMIMEQLYALGTANAVMILSEIDKANSVSTYGNPLDVCLPLLDGLGFMDNYLELKLPTEGIFYIATCNDTSSISKPILDRFYRIDIPAYSAEDKKIILEQYTMPQTLKRLGLEPREVTLSDQAKELFFTGYALEPGVRDVEQYVEKLVSHYLLLKEEGIKQICYTKEDLRKLLGPKKLLSRNLIRRPGMVTSCCYEDGKAHTFILEAISKRGSGKLEVYNVPDDIQKGYCSIAYECANYLLNGALQERDIIIAATEPLPESSKNYIGIAVCAAILSAVKGFAFSRDELFLGGCDLLGNMYLDINTIDPILKHISGEARIIYTALGAAKLCADYTPPESVSIAEFPNMLVLFELAAQKKDT